MLQTRQSLNQSLTAEDIHTRMTAQMGSHTGAKSTQADLSYHQHPQAKKPFITKAEGFVVNYTSRTIAVLGMKPRSLLQKAKKKCMQAINNPDWTNTGHILR